MKADYGDDDNTVEYKVNCFIAYRYIREGERLLIGQGYCIIIHYMA